MRRTALTSVAAAAAGSTSLTVVDVGTGWPAVATVHDGEGAIDIALHVGPVGLSQRDRDDVERRFQNPGSKRPVQSPGGLLPILLGVWQEAGQTVFVGLDGRSRLGRETRFSLFVPLQLLQAAASAGWAEQYSTSGEKLTAFLPPLLPEFVRTVQAGVEVDQRDVSNVVAAAGMLDGADPVAAERGRRTVSALVRDAIFSRDVRAAYDHQCAMCGLKFSLIVGAHIYPVAAPGSVDAVWNGLALCHHHHSLFDAHKIYVDPETAAIKLHPDLIAGREESDACRSLVDGTFAYLVMPLPAVQRPRQTMFEQRYAYFSQRYDWAD